MKLKMIPIDKIVYEKDYYPRVTGKEDWRHVQAIREGFRTHPELLDPKCPECHPVYVAPRNSEFVLLDGLHRTKAGRLEGITMMPAYIEDIPSSEWLARSAELNIRSQRALDKGDRVWVAMRLLDEKWGDTKKVAALLLMPVETLEKFITTTAQPVTSADMKAIPIGRSNRRIGRKHYGFLKAPFGEFCGTSAGDTALKKQGPIAATTTIQILDAAIALLETASLDMTNKEIADRVKQLKRLIRTIKT